MLSKEQEDELNKTNNLIIMNYTNWYQKATTFLELHNINHVVCKVSSLIPVFHTAELNSTKEEPEVLLLSI
jgi:hypothetical protein